MEMMIAPSVHPLLSFLCFCVAATALAAGRRVHVRITRGGESLNEVDGILNACLGSRDEMAGERRGAMGAERVCLRDERRGFFADEYRGSRLTSEVVYKSQWRFIGLAVYVIIVVLGGRVAEGTRTEKRWQLLRHCRKAGKGGARRLARGINLS